MTPMHRNLNAEVNNSRLKLDALLNRASHFALSNGFLSLCKHFSKQSVIWTGKFVNEPV